MLVEIQNNKIVSFINISNPQSIKEFLIHNSFYISTDFNFVEALDLYEFDSTSNSFFLVKNWEQLKKQREEVAKISNSPTLEEFKEQKILELKNKVDYIYKLNLQKYPDVEIESFKDKAKETTKVIEDNYVALDQTPYLSALTGYTNIENRNALAFAIQEKIIKTAQLESYAVSKRDEIKACTTIEELEKVQL